MTEPHARGDAWWRHRAVHAAAVACSSALVWAFLAAVNARFVADGTELGAASGAALWIVPAAFVLFGFAWGRPLPTAGFTWLGVEAAVLIAGLFVPPAAGWGPFVWYATASGFVAGFSAYGGAWLRGVIGAAAALRGGRPAERDNGR